VTSQVGDLFVPLDVGGLPSNRDISNWNQHSPWHLNGVYQFPTDLDVEGNYVFLAVNTGLQIWQHTGSAAFPRLSSVYLGSTGGVRWCGTPELKHPIQWVDVLDGDSNVAVIGAGKCDLGMLVFNTTNKESPQFKYQADNMNLKGLWTTSVGGQQYAVAALESDETNGLRVYDLDAARALSGHCRDTSVGSGNCGVYRYALGSMRSLTGVHGSGRYVAASGERLEIFDVTTNGSPLVSFDPGINGFNFGVSLVVKGASTYLAALYAPTTGSNQNVALGIWNVTSCLAGGCVGTPPLLDTALVSAANSPRFLSTSLRQGRPYLYVGTEFTCTRNEADWLFEITGDGAAATLTRVPTRVGYWEWYYPSSNPNGAFDARPRRAKFLGDYLYRAAWTFFDVHRFVAPSGPTAGFTWAAGPVYPGVPVQFTDTSLGLPTQWTWDIGADGSIDAVVANPQLTLPTSGTYPVDVPVELAVANASGSDDITLPVTVIDPCPAASGISGPPASVSMCQALTFTAAGVTGVAPLDYSWTLVDDTGRIYDSSTEAVFESVASQAGRFRARLELSGLVPGCEAAELSGAGVTVLPLGALTAGLPSVVTQAGATVGFAAVTTSGSEWSWDFDDDLDPETRQWTPWSTDPVTGPAPSHTYAVPNFEGLDAPRNVRVRVRNCVDPGPVESEPLELYVEFGEAPVVNEFRPSCIAAPFCVIDTGTVVNFVVDVRGDPTLYEWDWDGDGEFEQSSPTPITSHLYCAPSPLFRPRIRTTRLGLTAEAESSVEIFLSGPDLCVPPLFADGFEGGTTAAWTQTVP
jgi:PKD repeat protein